ncbi:MAG: hypothetical protein Kow00103_14030 [Candidatus Caldatribacteriota bacterium]
MKNRDEKRIQIFVGGFGSGKTEIAINYSFQLRRKYKQVAIVDLDIVNPYFRTREVRDSLKLQEIRLIAPEKEMAYADLPLISPEIKGMLQNTQYHVILDVGGDEVGSVVLGSFSSTLQGLDYEMSMVVNVYRPFTREIAQILQLAKELEKSSRLKLTSIISNPNLLELTDKDTIIKGHKLIEQVARELKLPIRFLCIEKNLAPKIKNMDFNQPIFYLKKYMQLPWK